MTNPKQPSPEIGALVRDITAVPVTKSKTKRLKVYLIIEAYLKSFIPRSEVEEIIKKESFEVEIRKFQL